MGTMNISLPDTLRDFVDGQVSKGGYGTSSEYVRELIRRDQDRLRLRSLLLSHRTATHSPLAERILRDFDRELPRFWQIVPKEMLDRLAVPVRPAEALRA